MSAATRPSQTDIRSDGCTNASFSEDDEESGLMNNFGLAQPSVVSQPASLAEEVVPPDTPCESQQTTSRPKTPDSLDFNDDDETTPVLTQLNNGGTRDRIDEAQPSNNTSSQQSTPASGLTQRHSAANSDCEHVSPSRLVICYENSCPFEDQQPQPSEKQQDDNIPSTPLLEWEEEEDTTTTTTTATTLPFSGAAGEKETSPVQQPPTALAVGNDHVDTSCFFEDDDTPAFVPIWARTKKEGSISSLSLSQRPPTPPKGSTLTQTTTDELEDEDISQRLIPSMRAGRGVHFAGKPTIKEFSALSPPCHISRLQATRREDMSESMSPLSPSPSPPPIDDDAENNAHSPTPRDIPPSLISSIKPRKGMSVCRTLLIGADGCPLDGNTTATTTTTTTTPNPVNIVNSTTQTATATRKSKNSPSKTGHHVIESQDIHTSAFGYLFDESCPPKPPKKEELPVVEVIDRPSSPLTELRKQHNRDNDHSPTIHRLVPPDFSVIASTPQPGTSGKPGASIPSPPSPVIISKHREADTSPSSAHSQLTNPTTPTPCNSNEPKPDDCQHQPSLDPFIGTIVPSSVVSDDEVGVAGTEDDEESNGDYPQFRSRQASGIRGHTEHCPQQSSNDAHQRTPKNSFEGDSEDTPIIAGRSKTNKMCDKQDVRRKRKSAASSCSDDDDHHRRPSNINTTKATTSPIKSPLKRRRSLPSSTERDELVRQSSTNSTRSPSRRKDVEKPAASLLTPTPSDKKCGLSITPVKRVAGNTTPRRAKKKRTSTNEIPAKEVVSNNGQRGHLCALCKLPVGDDSYLQNFTALVDTELHKRTPDTDEQMEDTDVEMIQFVNKEMGLFLDDVCDRTNSEVYKIHFGCAKWSAEVYEDEKGNFKNVLKTIKRGKKLRCCVCKQAGATIGCCKPHCNNNYHFPCALLDIDCNLNQSTWELQCFSHAKHSDDDSEVPNHHKTKQRRKKKRKAKESNNQRRPSPLSDRKVKPSLDSLTLSQMWGNRPIDD